MTNFIKTITTVLFVLTSVHASAQTIATLEVTLNSGSAGLDVPASIDLDKITVLHDSVLKLSEVQGGKRIPVPYQIENESSRVLYWLVKNGTANKKRIYELSKNAPAKVAQHIETVQTDSALTISSDNKSLLRFNTYNKKLTFPQIKDTLTRSGFIHPLYTPHGQPLTRIEAWDHKHHMGLWSAWTHVLFERDTIDFWNLYRKEGNIRFANVASVNDGPVYAEHKTLQQHVAYKKDGSQKVAMNEMQSVRIYQPEKGKDYYLLDITIHLNAASASPVNLLKYNYSGLGWRATEKWNKSTCEVLTSEGIPRKGADGTRARWILVQGKLDNDYGGAVMMTTPTNYNYPEPVRVWPENIFNNGDMYTNFVPVYDRDWLIEPGKDYVLKYRFVVFNGKFDKDKSESAWRNFANPPVVNIKLNKR